MADKVIVSREKLVAVGDAVREKTGGTEALTLDELAGAVDGIKGEDLLAARLNNSLKIYESAEVLKMGNYAFYACSALESVSCPSCVQIDTATFQNCTSLKQAYFPSCTVMGGTVFRGCSALEDINFPVLTSTSTYVFAECVQLKKAYFPELVTVSGAAFQGCSQLESAYLPKANSIGAMCFQNCSSLRDVVIRQDSRVCSLAATTAFAGTPIADGDGYIYVPASLVGKYKTMTNWTTYASQIRAIEDYPEITGG